MSNGVVDGILSGVAGGLAGGLNQYSYEREFAQKKDDRAKALELEQLKLDVRTMLAQLAESGKDARYEASGNTVVQQTGATERNAATIAGAGERNAATIAGAGDRNDATIAGQNDRWATPSGNATLGSETTRRGQDIGATTTRRGQDLTFETTTRGQDVTQRGQDMTAGTAAAAETGRATRAPMWGAMRGVTLGGTPVTGAAAVNAPGQPPLTPIQPPAAAPAGTTPVTQTPRVPPAAAPGAPAAAKPAAAAPNRAADEAEAARLIAAFDAEKDPAKKAELQKQMAAALARLKGGK